MKKCFIKTVVIILTMLSILVIWKPIPINNNNSDNHEITKHAEACEQKYNFNIDANYAILMADAISSGNYNQAKSYESLRNQKKEYLGIKDDLTYNNLLLLSKIVHAEAGSNWLTEEHRQLVASVVLNRVDSPEFPNSMYDVIHQKGQYSSAGSSYFKNMNPSRACVFSALSVIAGGSIAPADVIFQSNFKQGSGVYKSIYDSKLGTTYFCYSNNRKLYR